MLVLMPQQPLCLLAVAISPKRHCPGDKPLCWVFHQHPDLILELLPDLAAVGGGYRSSAPVLKARKRRFDGLLQVPGASTGAANELTSHTHSRK